MKTLALILVLASVGLSQDTSKVYIPTRTSDGLLKMMSVPKAWLSGEGFQPQATATVDTSAGKIATQTMLGTKQNIIANLSDTSKYAEKIDTVSFMATKTDLSNLLVIDTLAFTTSGTRTAKKIVGIKSTSWFVASPRKQADALPVAGDLLSVRCKTDSIIIFRAAGTTSGLQVTIIGKK